MSKSYNLSISHLLLGLLLLPFYHLKANDSVLNAAIYFSESAENIRENEEGYSANFDTNLSGMSFNEQARDAAIKSYRAKMNAFSDQAEKNSEKLLSALSGLDLGLRISGTEGSGKEIAHDYTKAFAKLAEKISASEADLKAKQDQLNDIKMNLFKLKSLMVFLDKKSKEELSPEQRESIDLAIREVAQLIEKNKTKLYSFSTDPSVQVELMAQIDKLDEVIVENLPQDKIVTLKEGNRGKAFHGGELKSF